MPFTKDTLDFLVENRLRNDRGWYQEHRERFQQSVLSPMAELVEELAPAMLHIDPLFITTAKVDKTISRIYRDTRFSKDKSLYRDVMWVVFTRDKKQFPNYPGLALEFSPRGFRYGGGYFQAPPDVMAQLRAMVLEKDPLYLAAERSLSGQDTFHVEGECYKRPHYPNETPQRRDWLERKTACVMHNSKEFALFFSPGLGAAAAGDLLKLKPVYELFLRARERAGG